MEYDGVFSLMISSTQQNIVTNKTCSCISAKKTKWIELKIEMTRKKS